MRTAVARSVKARAATARRLGLDATERERDAPVCKLVLKCQFALAWTERGELSPTGLHANVDFF